MRNIIFMLLCACLLLSAHSYANPESVAAKSSAVAKPKKCLFPKSRKRAPDWICTAHDDTLAVTAVGSFHKSGAGNEFMEQMAAADARVNLARKLQGSVRAKITGSAGNVALDGVLIDKMTDEQLQGTRVIKSIYGPKGRLYVLMGLDEAGAQKLREAVAANYREQKLK